MLRHDTEARERFGELATAVIGERGFIAMHARAAAAREHEPVDRIGRCHRLRLV